MKIISCIIRLNYIYKLPLQVLIPLNSILHTFKLKNIFSYLSYRYVDLIAWNIFRGRKHNKDEFGLRNSSRIRMYARRSDPGKFVADDLPVLKRIKNEHQQETAMYANRNHIDQFGWRKSQNTQLYMYIINK